MVKHPHARPGQPVLSSHLENHFRERGHTAGLAMPDDAPMALYIAAEIDQLFEMYPHLEDTAAEAVLFHWNSGFTAAIRERVQWNARATFEKEMYPERWPDDTGAHHFRIVGRITVLVIRALGGKGRVTK